MLPRHTLITLILAIAAVSLAAVLSGCASLQPPQPTPQEKAQRLGAMLSAAGFRMVPADTPESQQKLASVLPLDVQYTVGRLGKMHYWMADPYDCKCMYVGSEQAFQKYEKMKLNEEWAEKEDRIAQENLEYRQMEEMDMQEEMFNPYGGFGYFGPNYYW